MAFRTTTKAIYQQPFQSIKCRPINVFRVNAVPRQQPYVYPDLIEMNCFVFQYIVDGVDVAQEMETKQELGTAGQGNILGCCLVSLCFPCDIHSIHSVLSVSQISVQSLNLQARGSQA